MTSGQEPRGGLAGLPQVVWVLAGGSFVNNFGSFVVPFLMLYLVHRGYGRVWPPARSALMRAGR
jgi:hypothetical protein